MKLLTKELKAKLPKLYKTEEELYELVKPKFKAGHTEIKGARR